MRSANGCGSSTCGSPIATVTTSPACERPGSIAVPSLRPWNDTCSRHGSPHRGTSPVVASTPLGMSIASTGAPWRAIRWIASEIGRRGAPCEPVPSSASTTTSAPARRVACGTPSSSGDVQHGCRIPAEALARSREDDPHVQTLVAEMARYDEAVSAVVARPADDRHAARIRVAGPEHGGSGRSRDLHQGRAGQAGVLDHASIELAQVLGPPQRLHGP